LQNFLKSRISSVHCGRSLHHRKEEQLSRVISAARKPKMIRVLLPMILEHLDVPEQTKEEIQKSLELMK